VWSVITTPVPLAETEKLSQKMEELALRSTTVAVPSIWTLPTVKLLKSSTSQTMPVNTSTNVTHVTQASSKTLLETVLLAHKDVLSAEMPTPVICVNQDLTMIEPKINVNHAVKLCLDVECVTLPTDAPFVPQDFILIIMEPVKDAIHLALNASTDKKPDVFFVMVMTSLSPCKNHWKPLMKMLRECSRESKDHQVSKISST
jgi:molybdopterin-guanine dinucleotide biosynthesis protein A